MVKITLEFPTLDAAIVAMGKLVGPLPAPKKKDPDAAPVLVTSLADVDRAVAAEIARKERKGRADKGKPRGSYKKALPGEPEAASSTTSGEVPTAPAAQVIHNDSLAPSFAAPEPKAEAPTASAPAAEPATAPVTRDQVRVAFEKYFEANGTEKSLAKLNALGAARLRDVKDEDLGRFVASLAA